MIINLQCIFLFLIASQVLGCYSNPIPINNDFEEQNLMKRNPMDRNENRHGQNSASQTNNSGLRPGRQHYQKFNLSSSSTASAAPSAPPLPPQHSRFERNRPEPIRTGRNDRLSHSTYTVTSHNPHHHHYVGSSYSRYDSPPRGRYDGRTSHSGANIGGAIAGAAGNAVIADSLGMQPGMVMAPDRYGHTHMRYGYVTPIGGGGGGGGGGDGLDKCFNCFTGNSDSSSP